MYRLSVLALGFLLSLLPACAAAAPPRVTTTTTTTIASVVDPPPAPSLDPLAATFPAIPVMGKSVYTPVQLVEWYRSKKIVQAPGSCATVEELAILFVTEGARENVRGDLAFIQAMLETGWLLHSTRVPASYCNYSGIGAVDSGTTANQFDNALMGVRAQIHHLRAYADTTVTCSNFKTPNASPRCHLVKPKGKAKTWNEMGNGMWASDPYYSIKFLNLFADLQKLIPK